MRYYIRILGHVQGVGYRYFVTQTAKKYQLTGWVRNCENGDVECEAQGDENSLQLFAHQLESGHTWAHVQHLTYQPMSDVKNESHFEIIT